MTTSIRQLGRAIFAALLLCALPAGANSSAAIPAAAAGNVLPIASMPPLAHRVVGGEFDFSAAEGDTLAKIGARFGESQQVLARDNGKQVADRLHAGETIHVDNRHIVPFDDANLIEINLPQRMLFHFEEGNLIGEYPVAIGMPGKKWQTPIGAFKIIEMQEDPTWRVPASIQREEEVQGKNVIDEIDPGPSNRLGKYWIGLSFPVIGIHGTNRPSSVYSDRTHGCVRLHPADIKALFSTVDVNDSGVIVYYPLMLARTIDGHIFLESERDVYRKGTGGIDAVKALARTEGIDNLIAWDKAGEVVTDQDGIARDVTSGFERAGETPALTAAATEVDREVTDGKFHAPPGLIATALPPG